MRHLPPALAEALESCAVVPVVTRLTPETAPFVAACLVEGGVTAIEVELHDAHALPTIRTLVGRGLVVGAGTVRTPAQLAAVTDAGAQFAVSPGLTPNLAAAEGVPLIPGAATASEVMAAAAEGFHTLRLFPAESLGGHTALRVLSAPFPDIRWMPSGGIGPGEVAGYLGIRSVIGVGADWVVTREHVDMADHDALVARAAHAVQMAGRSPR